MHLWELLLYCTSHYCKNYQFYSFQKMLRKSQIASRYCKNYQFHTFKPSGQKLPHITAKITDFIFSTHCPENHYCKNYQFYIYRSVPRKTLLQKLPISYFPVGAHKNTNFIFPAQCPEKITNFIFPALCPENPQIYPN